MAANLKKNGSKNMEDSLSPADEEARVKALRDATGPLSGRAAIFATDDCFRRYLRARNWNVKKSEKMLKETLKWRATFKPEEIKWEDVAAEGETGKVYRANFVDRAGRSVLVMRPAQQNTSDQKGQIKHLVYSMENAILNLPPDQEQMVWLIDFKGWTVRKSVPISIAREVAYVLQNMYPERLGIAILYDPPRLFETFWAIVRPFLDVKTFNKVKFVYTKNKDSVKIIEEFFDFDLLETSFGGRNPGTYNHVEYGKQMRLDDVRTAQHWRLGQGPDVSSVQLDGQGNGPSLKEMPMKDKQTALEPEAAQTASNWIDGSGESFEKCSSCASEVYYC